MTERPVDLYRIDLTVISKYIGETEKNLDIIFAAAAAGAVQLLFDETDALFGRRSEVRNPKDRYANLVILATSLAAGAVLRLCLIHRRRRVAKDGALGRARVAPFGAAVRSDTRSQVDPPLTDAPAGPSPSPAAKLGSLPNRQTGSIQ